MAGPVACVLLPAAPTDEQLEDVDRAISAISSTRESRKFWVANTAPIGGSVQPDTGAPFAVSSGPINKVEDYFLEDAADDPAAVERALGFKPDFVLCVIAFSSGPANHRILGELVLFLAKTLGGIVDVDGSLQPGPAGSRLAQWDEECGIDPSLWPDYEQEFAKAVRPIKGRVFTFPSTTCDGRLSAGHMCDPEFLENWLRHDRFHMVK